MEMRIFLIDVLDHRDQRIAKEITKKSEVERFPPFERSAFFIVRYDQMALHGIACDRRDKNEGGSGQAAAATIYGALDPLLDDAGDQLRRDAIKDSRLDWLRDVRTGAQNPAGFIQDHGGVALAFCSLAGVGFEVEELRSHAFDFLRVWV
jgi:hypothetical protein